MNKSIAGRPFVVRGFTLLEMTLSSAIFLLAIVGFIGSVQMCAEGTGFQNLVSQEVRRTEQMVDDMMVGIRWISVSDPNFKNTYPTASLASLPLVSFRRIVNTDANGNPQFGDTITYYWLPSVSENNKYAAGLPPALGSVPPVNTSFFSASDIDGIDHDANWVKNDGVIWRQISNPAPLNGQLAPLGYETFAAGTTDLRVVMDHVPPPFQIIGGTIVPTDSFRVDMDPGTHTVAITIKRFVNAGVPVNPDMPQPPPVLNSVLPASLQYLAAPVPTTKVAIIPAPGTVTVYTLRRRYCVRNP